VSAVVARFGAVREQAGRDIAAAASLAEEGLWVGLSGEPVSGEEARELLVAAAEVLVACGWGWGDGLVTLVEALHEARRGPRGGMDAWAVGVRCLELLLRARTGAAVVSVEAWEQRRGRVLGDVLELLATAARFAQGHGPQGGAR
jgi:hypothetical protein